jgi:hypothetical protein
VQQCPLKAYPESSQSSPNEVVMEESINIVYKVHRICERMKYQPIVLFLKAIICQELNE